MSLDEKQIAATMRQQGYKLTPQRRALLEVIAASHDHLTPADIHDKVRQEHPNIGLVTVYRTLDLLSRLGFICEVHAAGNSRSYLLRRPSGHHHHLICSDCGAVVDFINCGLVDLESRLSRDTGFTINGHLLEFEGRCQNCQSRAAAPKEMVDAET